MYEKKRKQREKYGALMPGRHKLLTVILLPYLYDMKQIQSN
jgi:hypothetical protein